MRLIKKASKVADSKNYEYIVSLLKNENRNIRYEALDTLSLSFEDFLKREDIQFLVDDSYPKIAAKTIYIISTQFNFKSDKIYPKILKFLSHKDELLAISMIEVLHTYLNYLKPEDIKPALKSKSGLVRSYAMALYGDIANTKKDILRMLNTERSSQVKMAAYAALYSQGEEQYLQKLIDLMLHTKQYRVRSASVKTLYSLVNKKNHSPILNALLKLKKKEETVAVLSSLNECIKLLKKESELKNDKR